MNRKRTCSGVGHRGFSLIEVLVSLVIIGVGMLGIAKIQALAYASTGTAALRSLAAIEASSLASAMRANRLYWTVAGATAAQTITIALGSVTASTDAALVGTSPAPPNSNTCKNVTCTQEALAVNDIQLWAQTLNALLPGSQATVTCLPNPIGTTYPVGCSITVNWTERNVAINAQSAGQTMGGVLGPSYTLYVEP
jgi:type IV pilus assembly protein PilV